MHINNKGQNTNANSTNTAQDDNVVDADFEEKN